MAMKKIVVYVDAEIHGWLDEKSRKGYKKSGFIHHVLQRQMEFEKRRSPNRQPWLGEVAKVEALR